MRWLHNISFSSPSSSSSTLSDHHSSHNPRGKSYFNNNTNRTNNNINDNSSNNGTQGNSNVRDSRGPRLTRQKKLRHLRTQDIVRVPNFSQTDNTQASISLSRSNSSYDQMSSTFKSLPSSSTYSATARPLPLPLPLPVREDNGESRLLSPREASGNGRGVEERERDGFRDRVDAAGAGDGVSSQITSVFSGCGAMKMPEYLDTRSPRTGHQDLNRVVSPKKTFTLTIPAKSAPSSPFGSPVPSPQKMNVNQMFQNYYNVPKGNKVWSAPEMPFLPGFPPPAFFDYTAFSADNSPLQSPRSRSPCRNPVSPSGPSSPMHSKMSREGNGLVEVHPLPLPPGAAISSPSAPILQVPAKPEYLPMNSQWQKGKLIGRGTFGSVYVASNRETGALCAMKEVEIFPDDPKSAECIKQLAQEIKVLSQLKHTNIVQYYGSEIVEDKFYIYLEYVHPGSINKYIREHCGAITESVVRNFTRHILSGLSFLHSKKTIHRDIKGANLLVDACGVVKLADFGMAKHLTGQAADLSLKGSPYWMAPELMMAVMQKDNKSDLALAVDIWSLGCTIIEMFTGKPPWSEYEGAAAMFKVMRDTPSIPENLSADGKDFLRCCFRRNPAERPTASKLLEHRFLKNSQQADVPSCSHSFCGRKSTDKPQSPREQSEGKIDQFPLFLGPHSPTNLSSESLLHHSFSPVRAANDPAMKLPT